MHATIYPTCLNFSAYIIASLPKLLLNWCLCSSTLREINDFYASYKEWNIQTWHSTSQLHKSINVWAWRHGGEQKDFCEKWSRAKRFLAIWYRIIFRWEENCKINLNFQKRFCSFINSKEWNMQIWKVHLSPQVEQKLPTSEVQVSLDSPFYKIEVKWSTLWISTEVSPEIVAIWEVITKIWKESLMKSFPWVGAVEGY